MQGTAWDGRRGREEDLQDSGGQVCPLTYKGIEDEEGPLNLSSAGTAPVGRLYQEIKELWRTGEDD